MTFVVLLFGTDLFSRRNVLPIIWWLESLFGWHGLTHPGGEMGAEEGLLRKAAHFLEYGLLALAWLQMMSGPRWRRIAFAFLACVAIAILDELQQAFIASYRTGSPWDVLLDASGAATALLLAMLATHGDSPTLTPTLLPNPALAPSPPGGATATPRENEQDEEQEDE